MTTSNMRDTFGIIDPTTLDIYEDIIDYHLGTRLFTQASHKDKYILEKGIFYILHMDSKLRRRLHELSYPTQLNLATLGMETQKVIISFQHRTTGYIALARIYQENKSNIGAPND